MMTDTGGGDGGVKLKKMDFASSTHLHLQIKSHRQHRSD